MYSVFRRETIVFFRPGSMLKLFREAAVGRVCFLPCTAPNKISDVWQDYYHRDTNNKVEMGCFERQRMSLACGNIFLFFNSLASFNHTPSHATKEVSFPWVLSKTDQAYLRREGMHHHRGRRTRRSKFRTKDVVRHRSPHSTVPDAVRGARALEGRALSGAAARRDGDVDGVRGR